MPDLQDVVLGDTADHPGVSRIQSEIRNLSCVPSMDKLERERERERECVGVCHMIPPNLYWFASHLLRLELVRELHVEVGVVTHAHT